MAPIKWAQTVDANQKQLQNIVIHPNSGAPTPAPIAGQVWYDTATGKLMYRDGVAAANIDPRARAAHTGTQAASTISDLATVVQAYSLSTFAVPTADLDIGTRKLINVVDPTTAQQAATKNYVDNALVAAVAGMSWKDPVRLATVANDTLSGLAARDGVTPIAGDRVLVKAQSSAATNGIYIAAAGAWARSSDADTAAELQGGTIVSVDEGTAGAPSGVNTMWMLTADVVTLGTTAQSWTQFGTGAVYTASLGVQLVGNDIRANLGAGLTLSGNTIVPDYTAIMARKVAVGFVGTTGLDVTITTGFTVANKSDYLVEITEDATGTKVLCGVVGTSTTQVTLSFDTIPTSNQYRYQILGLS